MKYSKEELNLENGLKKEWIITNGIGGYCSSTIIGANTRRYHGLLIAPLTPPAQRYLILSKVDESIKIEDVKYDLYTNIGENYISQGYKYQEKFEKDNFPVYTYKVNETDNTEQQIQFQKCIEAHSHRIQIGIQYRQEQKGNPGNNLPYRTLSQSSSIQFRHHAADYKCNEKALYNQDT